ncbi:MaoC family dehydratase [Amylibacter sp.]|nr:MaoC family dehydratase [Amylibacter sp.]
MTQSKIDLEEYSLLIGSKIGISDWITVSQKMIDDFCDVTGDYQFIHNDPNRAASETPFGGSIAHGFLTLSLITKMYKDTTPIIINHELVINYGLNRVRFLAPVPSGARIRGIITLGKVEPRGKNKILTENKIVVEIENQEKPAMLGTWVTLLIKDEI